MVRIPQVGDVVGIRRGKYVKYGWGIYLGRLSKLYVELAVVHPQICEIENAIYKRMRLSSLTAQPRSRHPSLEFNDQFDIADHGDIQTQKEFLQNYLKDLNSKIPGEPGWRKVDDDEWEEIRYQEKRNMPLSANYLLLLRTPPQNYHLIVEQLQ